MGRSEFTCVELGNPLSLNSPCLGGFRQPLAGLLSAAVGFGELASPYPTPPRWLLVRLCRNEHGDDRSPTRQLPSLLCFCNFY